MSQNRTEHWIALEGAANARAVVPGVLLRSDNLQRLSESDVRLLVDEESLEVVLDLRTDVEVAQEGPGPLVHEPAVRIEHRSLYPESGENTDLEGGTVRLWAKSDADAAPEDPPIVHGYMGYLRRRPDSIVGSLRTIARADGAVLAHCAAGKDRTGVVIAIALDAAGVDRNVIAQDYLASSERIVAIFDRLLSSPTYRRELEGHDPQAHAPVPGTIERVLELMDERFGGSAAWLQANGLEASDLESLRHRLCRDGSLREAQSDGTEGRTKRTTSR